MISYCSLMNSKKKKKICKKSATNFIAFQKCMLPKHVVSVLLAVKDISCYRNNFLIVQEEKKKHIPNNYVGDFVLIFLRLLRSNPFSTQIIHYAAFPKFRGHQKNVLGAVFRCCCCFILCWNAKVFVCVCVCVLPFFLDLWFYSIHTK